MLARSLSAGLTALRRRPGLAVLLFAVNLALAFVLALPLYAALQDAVGATGFGPDLAAGFDLVLWTELGAALGAALRGIGWQVLWIVPLYVLWQAAAAVGLIHALQGLQIRSFWQGVGRYTGRAVLLALSFLVLLVIVVVIIFGLAIILAGLWSSEAGSFWINFVILPTMLIAGVAVLDLMHDYARIALVVEEQPVHRAMATGLGWPRRHGQASLLYLVWFALAMVLLLAPTLFDAEAAAATTGGVWILFLIQQLCLLLRAAVTVGWLGSETYFFETIRLREAPLIAEDTLFPEPPPDGPPAA